MVVVEVRVFAHETNVAEAHGYLVGATRGGLSDVLERVHVDERTCTLRRLRGLIELGTGAKGPASGERRSMLFREILMECESTPNPHCWTHRVRRSSYRLAFLPAAEGEQLPELVPLEQEPENLAVPFLREHARRPETPGAVEVVVVPLSQVGPGCGACCKGCEKCSASRLPGSTAYTAFYQDGRVQRVQTNAIDRINIDIDPSELNM